MQNLAIFRFKVRTSQKAESAHRREQGKGMIKGLYYRKTKFAAATTPSYQAPPFVALQGKTGKIGKSWGNMKDALKPEKIWPCYTSFQQAYHLRMA